MDFVKKFEEKVKKTIEENSLITKNEKIAVAVSGGKDSTTTLYLLHKFGYNVGALHIDLAIGKYSEKILNNIKKLCQKLNVDLHVIDLKDEIGSSVCFLKQKMKEKVTNCMLCGVIKKWLLNKKARELNFSKLATGHNLDDEIETILMNLFQGNFMLNANLGIMPGIIENKKFVQRIKPLYFCTNEEIKRYAMAKKFPVIYESCPCSVNAFRKTVREFIKTAVSEKDKIKMINKFLKILPEIKESSKPNKLKYCKICNEPSRNEICKKCLLLKEYSINFKVC